MKKIAGVLALVCVLALPGMASAADEKPLGVYVGGHLGMSILNFSDRKMNETDGDWSWSGGSKTDSGFGGGLSVGYDFDPRFNVPVRLELDYTARARASLSKDQDFTVNGNLYNEEMKHKVGLQTLMLNAWVDIPTGTAFTPYLGGGVGLGFIDYKTNYNITDKGMGVDNETNSASKNETNFTWSVGGGVAYDFNDNWTVDLGYRYIDAGKVSGNFKDDDGTWAKSKVKVQSHDMMLGVRYTF